MGQRRSPVRSTSRARVGRRGGQASPSRTDTPHHGVVGGGEAASAATWCEAHHRHRPSRPICWRLMRPSKRPVPGEAGRGFAVVAQEVKGPWPARASMDISGPMPKRASIPDLLSHIELPRRRAGCGSDGTDRSTSQHMSPAGRHLDLRRRRSRCIPRALLGGPEIAMGAGHGWHLATRCESATGLMNRQSLKASG